MRIAFLAADDPLYLPDYFDRVLRRRASEVLEVSVVPPLYQRQTTIGAAWRYFRTFGFGDTVRLTARVIGARLARRSIQGVCQTHGVPSAVVADVNAPAFVERLRLAAPDVVVSVSCPQIFRRALMEVPSKGLLNVHGAILPAYRGVMPGFWMLANGERSAGVSVFFVGDRVDAGDLCGQRVFEIRPAESLDTFLRRSKAIAADLTLEVLESIERGDVRRRRMEGGGSYYSWPDRDAVHRFRAAGRSVW